MSLRIVTLGLYTILVDFGRPGARRLGVPVGGAADRWSLALGNALVGNPPDAAALEFSLVGPTVQTNSNLACVVYGAPFALAVNQQPLEPGKTFNLKAGDELHVGGTRTGMRAYLCVRGGFQEKQILGSQSSLAPLPAGTELRCTTGSMPIRLVRSAPKWNREPNTLRVVVGPQVEWFPETPFYSQHFQVTQMSNRMGLRLHGDPIPRPEREMTSEAVSPGSVQVVRDGQCIVLGVDGQTIGGYPKIAQVISADIDKIGQLRPGERIRFSRVSLEEAKLIYQEKQAELTGWIVRLRTTL
jgi:biotin-dependent carboxylase-like uncharacterized protein